MVDPAITVVKHILLEVGFHDMQIPLGITKIDPIGPQIIFSKQDVLKVHRQP